MKCHLEFDKNSEEKLYLQLYNIFKYKIINNNLTESQKLPSVRHIKEKYNVNISTVLKAYNLLESENYIVKIGGKGCFVANRNTVLINEKNKPILDSFYHGQFEHEGTINFAKGTLLPEYFPLELYKKFANDIFQENNHKIFEYQNVQGLHSLRKIISEIVEEEDIFVDNDNIIITSGTQQSLNTILNFFRQKGKPNIALANATYPNALNLFKTSCNIFTITQQSDGWDLNEFEELLNHENISFVYEVFNFQNPTGITWSEEKKKRLLELAEEHNFYIIEDNSFADFFYTNSKPMPIKALDKWNSDKVFYLKTFSKIIMPGIETALLIPPKKYLKQLILIKHSLGTTTTGFNQRILENFLTSEEYYSHFSLVRNHLKEKFVFLLKSISKLKEIKVIYSPKGGFFLWVELSKKINLEKFFSKCEENKINLVNNCIFFPNEIEKNKFRLSISALSLDEIALGIKTLETILRSSIHEIS